MRSTLQAKNAKKCKYFSNLSPPDLNSVISNPSRNSLIDFRCLRPQLLTQRHDANQRQSEGEHNHRRAALWRRCPCCGTRQLEVKAAGSVTFEPERSGGILEARNMGDG